MPDSVPLLLVDGSNLLWRAWYGFPTRIRSRSGADITGQFGFFALLRKAIADLNRPVETAVIFDSESAWQTRRAVAPDYKAHRQEASGPYVALADIQRGLTLFDLAWQESGRSEADDVIGVLTRRARDRPVTVMSTDKDFHQLLGLPGVRQLNTARGREDRWIDEAKVWARYGIGPAQWCDYRALVGDPSDGIGGVRGIGPVRARMLLQGGYRLEGLADSGRLVGRLGLHLLDQLESAKRARDLIRLQPDAQVSLRPRQRANPPLPLAALVLEHLGLW